MIHAHNKFHRIVKYATLQKRIKICKIFSLQEKPIEPTEALRAEEAKAKKFGIRGRVSKAMDVKEREVNSSVEE